MKIIISESQFNILSNIITINGVDVYKNLSNIEENKKIGINLLIDEVNNYKSSENLLRSGGFSSLCLDLTAFGFTEDSVKQIIPDILLIKWKDDYRNVLYEVKNSGLSKIDWSKKIKLKDPIDVSFDGKNFILEDGHHRYFAAKTLKKFLNVNLEIKANPILGLGHNDYDMFHREMFEKFNSI